MSPDPATPRRLLLPRLPAPPQTRPLVSDDVVRLSAFVRGHVQGVGFRWWVRSQALELGLDGFARNLPDGRVEVVAQGSASACERLEGRLSPGAGDPSRPGRVDGVGTSRLPVVAVEPGFVER